MSRSNFLLRVLQWYYMSHLESPLHLLHDPTSPSPTLPSLPRLLFEFIPILLWLFCSLITLDLPLNYIFTFFSLLPFLSFSWFSFYLNTFGSFHSSSTLLSVYFFLFPTSFSPERLHSTREPSFTLTSPLPFVSPYLSTTWEHTYPPLIVFFPLFTTIPLHYYKTNLSSSFSPFISPPFLLSFLYPLPIIPTNYSSHIPLSFPSLLIFLIYIVCQLFFRRQHLPSSYFSSFFLLFSSHSRFRNPSLPSGLFGRHLHPLRYLPPPPEL